MGPLLRKESQKSVHQKNCLNYISANQDQGSKEKDTLGACCYRKIITDVVAFCGLTPNPVTLSSSEIFC